MRLPRGWDQSVYFADCPKFGDARGEDSGCKASPIEILRARQNETNIPLSAVTKDSINLLMDNEVCEPARLEDGSDR